MMERQDLIRFERSDWSIATYVVEAAKKIADHFKHTQNYIPDFCRMLINSRRWTFTTLEEDLRRWSQNFGQRAEGRRKIVELVNESFQQCQSDEDINDLRGAMLEALVIASYGGTAVLTDNQFGWGAIVKVKKHSSQYKEVRYECPNPSVPPEDKCKNRASVDFGFWNGYHGKFYECKVQPFRIGCKERKYMETLSSALKEIGVSHEICFVSADSEERVKIRLKAENAPENFKAIGYNNLHELQSA